MTANEAFALAEKARFKQMKKMFEREDEADIYIRTGEWPQTSRFRLVAKDDCFSSNKSAVRIC